jgi:hypothetical protein
MTTILAPQSAELRAKGETLLKQADRLLCESWNERMWADGEPIDPSPTIAQAINGGYLRHGFTCISRRCLARRSPGIAWRCKSGAGIASRGPC